MAKAGKMYRMGSWKILKKHSCIYYFKDESVVLMYNNQYISFNSFNRQSKSGYIKFVDSLADSNDSDYDDLDSIFQLARINNVNISRGHCPDIKEGT